MTITIKLLVSGGTEFLCIHDGLQVAYRVGLQPTPPSMARIGFILPDLGPEPAGRGLINLGLGMFGAGAKLLRFCGMACFSSWRSLPAS